MKKSSNKRLTNDKDLASEDQLTRDYEIFKSRVANAVLDYMDVQSDPNLTECLQSASIFLSNISHQMENVFNSQKQVFNEQNDISDISDDIFSQNKQASSNAIH